MIITEYMENGSLDAFLRVGACDRINPKIFIMMSLSLKMRQNYARKMLTSVLFCREG